jgi:hypothetical protein
LAPASLIMPRLSAADYLAPRCNKVSPALSVASKVAPLSRNAFRTSRLERCSGLEERRHHVAVTILASEHERSHPELVGNVDFGSSPEQGEGDPKIVPMCCPVKRRRPVTLSGLRINMLSYQQAHARLVLALDRIEQPQVLCRAAANQRQEHNGGSCQGLRCQHGVSTSSNAIFTDDSNVSELDCRQL